MKRGQKSTNLSLVRGIDSINDFQIVSSAGVPSSGELTSHEYIEVIAVADQDRFGDDFADSPTVVLTEDIE